MRTDAKRRGHDVKRQYDGLPALLRTNLFLRDSNHRELGNGGKALTLRAAQQQTTVKALVVEALGRLLHRKEA